MNLSGILAFTVLLSAAEPRAFDRKLIVAVTEGDAAAVRALLGEGANPNARKMSDQVAPTALMLAAEADRADMVEVLAAAGADLEARDAGRATAVLWAISGHANAALAALIRAGSNVVDFQGSRGRNPLLTALAYRNEDAVELLIAADADVEAQGGELAVMSPLMLAAAHGSTRAVRWLLAAGANVDALSAAHRQTALDYAREHDRHEVAEILRRHGARRAADLVAGAPPPDPAIDVPPAGLETSSELSAEARSWYSGVLHRMGEPAICEVLEAPDGESYRFLWLRTFDEPVLVRMVGGPRPELTAKVLGGQSGYDHGELEIVKDRLLRPRHWRRLQQLLRGASFWQLPAEARQLDVIVLDGANWLLEGRHGDQCHVVRRWSPARDGPWNRFREIGLYLLDLARLGGKGRPVY